MTIDSAGSGTHAFIAESRIHLGNDEDPADGHHGQACPKERNVQSAC